MPIIHTCGFSFQITKAAVDIVRGLTGSMEGLQSLANYSNALLPALSRLLTLPKVRRILLVRYYYRFYLCWDGVSFFQEVSEAAAEALVNLSQNSSLAEAMVGIGLVKTTMDVLYKPECSIARLLVMLLVNLTQLEAGAASLLQVRVLLFIHIYIYTYKVTTYLYTVIQWQTLGMISLFDFKYKKVITMMIYD